MDKCADRPMVNILMVDDDDVDVRLTEDALRNGPVTALLNVVPNGEEAIAYLHGEGQYAAAFLPDLIVLDLKMPKKNGFEVLADIKADEFLSKIPVVALTSSEAPEDILRTMDLQASCCVTKPADLDEFDHVLNSSKDFCLTLVKLPPHEVIAQTNPV